MDKESFFAGLERKTGIVKLDNGWDITVQELSARQRGRLRDISEDEDPVRGQCKVVAMGCPMFTDEDVERLMDMPGGVVSAISDSILDISGLGDDAKENAKNV